MSEALNTGKSNEVISNQIFYKQLNQFAPRYKYVKVNMSNILGNTVAVTATGTTQVQFKLPYNTVFNLAKSKLSTLVPIQAQTTNTYGQLVYDCWPFGNQLVSFETGNGLQMLNLPEPSKYTKVVSKVNTSFKEFITTDIANLPHPCNSTTNTNGNNTTVSVPYLEPQYYSTSASATASNIPLFYELSNFGNTILSLDKDLYFGQNDIYLKYTIGGTNLWTYQTSTASPGTGTIATLNPALGALQNVYLYLAVEQNPVIIDNIIKQYLSSGLRFLIDYPIVTKSTTLASTNQAVVIPFVPAMGKFLKRIYHTVWNATESLNTALDNENSNANAKVTSYNTYLDSTKLQDDVVYTAVTANSTTTIYEDDWRINQPICKDTAILNYSVYQKNWFHADDFMNPDMMKQAGVVSSQNVRDGLPMERGIQWQFIATTANSSFIHDNFAIFVRELLVTPSGIMFA